MSNKNIKKSYWAVIPAEVRYCSFFTGGDPRLLYGEISALCNERGYCWASNDYFADLYKVDGRTIRRWVQALEKAGFIYVVIKGKERHIFLAHRHSQEMNTFEELEEPGETVEDLPEVEEEKPKPKKAKRVKEIKYTDEHLRLAELLLSKVIYNFPALENKKVEIGDWADDIRKLMDIDKADKNQIEFMIYWVHGGAMNYLDSKTGEPKTKTFEPHEFWSRNILSADKLRKQWYDNLIPQLQAAFKKEVKKNGVADLSNKPREAVAQL